MNVDTRRAHEDGRTADIDRSQYITMNTMGKDQVRLNKVHRKSKEKRLNRVILVFDVLTFICDKIKYEIA